MPNASARRRAGTSVAQQLQDEPYRFGFFQAVRLLERIARKQNSGRNIRPVGTDASPSVEAVRFRALPTRTFPPGEIDRLKPNLIDEEKPPFEMTVGFMGLYGPSGVLPIHYTQIVIDRMRAKDHAMRDFLDVFNHRIISHFFRAWEKYRFPIAYERNHLWETGEDDAYSEALFGLVGMRTKGMRDRQEVHDETYLYFSGFYAHRPRNAVSLERLLSEYFGQPITVQQFQGRWLYLDFENRSLLPTAENPLGQNCRLGLSIIVGEKVWSVEAAFRIKVGPLSRSEFEDFMPGSSKLTQLAQLVRKYVGMSLDFDVQPVLRGPETPPIEVLSDEPQSRLGYNTWLWSKPIEHIVDDAIFVDSGAPTKPIQEGAK